MANVRTFHENVITPSGVALGGFVDLEVHDSGDFYVHFHGHSSSYLESFDIDLRAYLTVPNGPVFFFHHSGHVPAKGDDDDQERGNNPLIRLYWDGIDSGGQFNVAHDYSIGGFVGTLEGLVKDIFDVGAAVVGGTTGAIIAVSREAIGWLNLNLGPGGTFGVLAGVVVFAASGGNIILATVAGIAVGAVTNALIDSRGLSPAEIALAQRVFCDTLPYDKITLTNLGTVGGRAFTAPGVDGRTYVNLGHAYDNPLGPYPNAYPAPGQELIHELTHAWQIEHTPTLFLPGLLCSGVVNQANYSVLGDNVYDYGVAGPAWSEFNQEQQGAIVDQWFGGSGHSGQFPPMDWRNPYADYVRRVIRGQGS